jgi:GH18 family chitinase
MCKLNRNVACASQGTEMSHVQVEKRKCHMCKSRNRKVTCVWHFCSSTYTCDISVPWLAHVTFLFNLHMWHFCSSTYTCDISVSRLAHVTFLFLDLRMQHFYSIYTCDISVPQLTHVTFLFLNLHMWQVEKQKCHMCKSRNRNVTCVNWTEMSHVQVKEQKCHMCKSRNRNVTCASRGTKM